MKLFLPLFFSILVGVLSISSLTLFAKDKVVHIATLEWPPYVGASLKNQGPTIEIVKQALEKKGYKVNFDFYPWVRAVALAQDGKDGTSNVKYDAYFPEYFSTEIINSKKFVFSDPLMSGPLGFCIKTARKADFNYRVKNDLNITYDELKKGKNPIDGKQIRFGVVRDYVNEEKFDARTFNVVTKATSGKDIPVDLVNSDELNIRKLNAGRIDLIFIDFFVEKYLTSEIIPEIQSGSITCLQPPIQNKDIFIAWSAKAENLEEKKAAFNDGLKQLKKDPKTIRDILSNYPSFKK